MYKQFIWNWRNTFIFIINIRYLKCFLYGMITILVTIFDWVTKKWILNNTILNKKIYVFSFLNIYQVHNYGIIFGLFSEKNTLNCYFLFLMHIFSLILITKIVYCKNFTKKSHILVSYLLILSGAVGNFIDRIQYGFIIDFIDFHYINEHFATFNISDINIFLGFIILLIMLIIKK